MSAAYQDNPKFQSYCTTSKNCSIEFIFGQICFFYNETQLEGEKCKFQKLQNKDHPSTCMLFTFENGSSAHALGGVSGVASFITTDEQLQ